MLRILPLPLDHWTLSTSALAHSVDAQPESFASVTMLYSPSPFSLPSLPTSFPSRPLTPRLRLTSIESRR